MTSSELLDGALKDEDFSATANIAPSQIIAATKNAEIATATFRHVGFRCVYRRPQ